MKLEESNLRLLSDEECQNISGGFFPALLLGAIVSTLLVPVAKSIWNSDDGSVKLPGGVEAKWEKDSVKVSDNKDINEMKKEIHKLEQKLIHLIPPFYEF